MKKLVLTTVVMSVMLVGFAQRQIPMSEFYPSEMIYEQLSHEQVEQMKTSNPVELLSMNYLMVNTAVVIGKPIDGNTQAMKPLDQYVPAGMSYDEEEIIRTGALNPYKWDLPQDKYRWNIFPLHRAGYYVVVAPETELDARLQAYLRSCGF